MKSESRRGFTLIELLTVIAIIGIMAGMLFPAINAVRKNAKVATSKSTFSQWCTAVNRYYTSQSNNKVYPNIGAKYDTSVDAIHKLEIPATTLKFIKCLSGKNPTNSPLNSADRLAFNRIAEEFCAFSKDDYANYGAIIDTSPLLQDKFGNVNIRVAFDMDSSGSIKGISGISLPDEIWSAKSGTGLGIDSPKGGIPARVIIFTTASDAQTYDGTSIVPLSAGEASDVIAIQ